jgi:hypothetical protein
MQLGGAAAATESEVSVGGGAFAAPWSPCTMAYTMRMCYISKESIPAISGGRSVKLSELAVLTIGVGGMDSTYINLI